MLFIDAALPQETQMNFATMNTLALADLLKRSHAEWKDGSTAQVRAEGERTYRAAKAYLQSLLR